MRAGQTGSTGGYWLRAVGYGALAIVTLGVLVTPILNRGRGSLLWPMLFHWQLINPFWPDAQPWDTLILVAVAFVVIWWNRDSMFTCKSAVTDVIPRIGNGELGQAK